MPVFSLNSFIKCLSIIVFMLATYAQAEPEPALIHVSAEGNALAKPDQVTIALDFSSTQLEAEDARKEVDQHVRKFLNALKKFELESSTLDSSQTSVYPQYDYRNSLRDFLGYQVNRKVSFTLKRLEQLEDLIKIITASKLSKLSKMQFGLSDPEFYQAEALSNAMLNSRAVALMIAEGYEVSLGKIHSVRHRTNQNSGVHRAMLMESDMVSSRAAPEPTYQQKDLEFKAHVDVAFTFD